LARRNLERYKIMGSLFACPEGNERKKVPEKEIINKLALAVKDCGGRRFWVWVCC
jgi:hypothetical protein